MKNQKKGPFILRSMETGRRPGSDMTFFNGCIFMPLSPTAEWCSLPVNARRFDTLEAATQGIVEWTLRYPAVIGNVQAVDLSSGEWE